MKPVVPSAVLALAIVAAAAWMFQGHKHIASASAQEPRAPAVERRVASPERPDTRNSDVVPVAHQPSPGVLDMMKAAKDYFALAKSILARAESGDASAQYALWQVHFMCYESSMGAFARENSWDEAVQKAAAMQVPIERAKKTTICATGSSARTRRWIAISSS